MQIIVDASVIIAWCMPDEYSPYAQSVMDDLTENASLLVPALWVYEVSNVINISVRRGRINTFFAEQVFLRLSNFETEIDFPNAQIITGHAFELAQKNNLTIYDAAYLELAKRRNAAFASLDQRLMMAAQAEGIELVA